MMPCAATWIDLETVIQSEVNQTEKDKYIISLICRIQKKMMLTYLQIGNRFIDLENKLTVTKWERRGRVNWGFGIDMCTLMYIK